MFVTPGISVDSGNTWCYSWEELNNALDIISYDDYDRAMYIDTIIEFMDEEDRHRCEDKCSIEDVEAFFTLYFEESTRNICIG